MTFKKPARQVDKVYLHCSASDIWSHDNIETIKEWHVEDKGWDFVGYHFFITKKGIIEEGRPLEKQPSAQGLYKGKYYNKGTIAICLSGKDPDLFTQKQFESLVKLCKEINQAYYKITFHGHCEVSNKTCPVFDYKEVLNLDDDGFMPLSTLSTKPKKKMSLIAASGIISLIKIFAPSIINKFKKSGRQLAENAAKKLIQKAEKKLGFKITDEKSANKARDQLDSKDLLELEKVALKTNAKMFSDELKYGEDLTKSWKDEFVTVITFLTFISIIIMVYLEPEKADELVSVIEALLSTPFGALFVFVGISAIGGKYIMSKLVDRFFK